MRPRSSSVIRCDCQCLNFFTASAASVVVKFLIAHVDSSSVVLSPALFPCGSSVVFSVLCLLASLSASGSLVSPLSGVALTVMIALHWVLRSRPAGWLSFVKSISSCSSRSPEASAWICAVENQLVLGIPAIDAFS